MIYRKWIKEVIEAPRDDHVVVAAHNTGHHGGPEPDSSEAWVDCVPDAKRSWRVKFVFYVRHTCGK